MRTHFAPLSISSLALLTSLLPHTTAQSPGGAIAPLGDRTDTVRQAVVGGAVRSVILFLGDGMGDSEITMARNYAVGASGRLALDTLPFTGAYTTYSVQEKEPTLPDYVAESAST